MKRIAIIVTTPMTRQGVTSVVLNLLKNMEHTRFKISFLSALLIEDWFCDELKAMDIEIVHLTSTRTKKCFSYIKELSDWLKTNKIDVMHVHGNSATMWFEIKAAKKAGVAVRIAHSHNSSCSSKTVHYVLRPLLIHDMSIGIGCSDLAQKFVFKNKKSMLLNNGIDTDIFAYDEIVRTQYRKDLGVDSDFVIGHVGNFVGAKNHKFICDIAIELNKIGIKDYKIVLVGDRGNRPEIEKHILDNNLSQNVLVLGCRSDMPQLYQMFDLFILPSLFEGFPMVLVEAQTSGLKCLISDKVTKTTNLLGTADFLPIDTEDAVKKWADAICKAMDNRNVDRKNADCIVADCGFSAKKSAEMLREIYNFD